MNNNEKLHAFSLIELMVVIAIVAILAAVAVPTYRTYMDKTKVNTLMPLFNSISANAHIFYTKHAYWPQAFEIGYPLDMGVGSGIFVNPTSYNPYVTRIYLSTAPYDCGDGRGPQDFDVITAHLDLDKLPTVTLDNYAVQYQFGLTRDDVLLSNCFQTYDGGTITGAQYVKCQMSVSYSDFITALCQ